MSRCSKTDDFLTSRLGRADSKRIFKEQPVPIGQFLEDDHYLGRSCKGYLSRKDNFWRKALEEICSAPLESAFWFLALTGGIGVGKTTAGCAGMAYAIYCLLCCRDPHKVLGVPRTDVIEFLIWNVTMNLADEVVWEKLSSMLETSPWFSQFKEIRNMRQKEEVRFANGIRICKGSRIGHTLGRSIFQAIIDEANFQLIDGQVRETFYSVIGRMESRYMKAGGRNPGCIWVISSATDKNSVLNSLIEEYGRREGVKVISATRWLVNPHLYKEGDFMVYKGSELRGPAIITPRNEAAYANEPENILKIPLEHKRAFETSIQDALRDIAGISISSRYKLFR